MRSRAILEDVAEFDAQQKKKQNIILTAGLVIFLLLYVLKLFYTGLKYQPLGADFALFGTGVYKDSAVHSGLLSYPFNAFLWSNFWGNLQMVQFILSAMYFGAVMLTYQALARCCKVTFVFPAVCLLAPFLLEGTFYVGGAISIVPGLFFMGLSLYCLQIFADYKSLLSIALFFIFQLLSFCFCKETAILSLLMSLMLIWLNSREMNLGVVFLAVFDFVLICAVYYFASTFFFDEPLLDVGGLTGGLSTVTNKLGEVFIGSGAKLTGEAFSKGMSYLAQNSVVFIPLLALLAIGTGAAGVALGDNRVTDGIGSRVEELFWAVVLMAMPLLAVFLVKGAVVELRTMLPCVFGLAFFINWIYKQLFGSFLGLRIAGGVVCAALIFFCSVGSVYEQYCYIDAGEQNNALLTAVKKEIAQTGRNDRVLIVNTQGYYEGTLSCGEHIRMVGCDSDTMKTAVVASHGSTNIAQVDVASHEEIAAGRTFTAEEFRQYQMLLGVVKGELVSLTLQETETGYSLLDSSGKVMWSGESAPAQQPVPQENTPAV